MANVTFSKKRVLELLGKKLDDKTLVDRSNMMGAAVDDLQGETLILDLTANRPDLLSEEGYARALKKFLDIEPGLSRYEVKKSGLQVIVDPSVTMRPYTACAIVKRLSFDEQKLNAIIQLQEKLAGTHGRNRKKAAYGIYPLTNITFPVFYRAEDPTKVRFRPLGHPEEILASEVPEKHQKGRDYKHLTECWKKFPFFFDNEGKVMCMLPFTNSHDTGKVDETTTEVFVECSGTDFNTCKSALAILTTALAETGGEIYSLDIVYKKKKMTTPDLAPRVVEVDSTYINKLLGLNLSQNEIEMCLEKMGHGVRVLDRSKLAVSVPAYRTDVLHPMDVVEDVAIGYGYDNFKAEIPNVATIGEEDIWTIRSRKIIEILIGLGFQETNTNHLMSEQDLTKAMHEGKGAIKAMNAVNIDYNVLRPVLLPIHLKILQENKHHDYPQKIAEVGRVITKDAKAETLAKETWHLSAAASHPRVDYSEIRSTIDALMKGLGIDYEVKESTHPTFMPGRTAEIFVNKKSIGFIGEINPLALNNFEIEMPTVALEIDVELLF